MEFQFNGLHVHIKESGIQKSKINYKFSSIRELKIKAMGLVL